MKIPLGEGTVARVSGTRWRERSRQEQRHAVAAEFMAATRSLSEEQVGAILGISATAVRRWRTIGVPKNIYGTILRRMVDHLDPPPGGLPQAGPQAGDPGEPLPDVA
ncbi:MAG: hypothetical protein AB1941_05835 [Gemmatimonadota bacterium]